MRQSIATICPVRRGSGDKLFPNEVAILTLVSERGKSSTADLMQAVAENAGESKPMNAATVFRIVNRLTQRGFIAHSWALPEQDAPQRAHRVFEVTSKGSERVTTEVAKAQAAAAAATANG